MYKAFYDELVKLSDPKFAEFSKRTIPSERPFIGVKIPEIRKLVKIVPIEATPEFLAHDPVSIEEVLARGFMIARLSYDEMVLAFDLQVSYIGDWCTCDTFCAAIRKTVSKHRKEFYDLKVASLLKTSEEFSTRVGVVLLLGYVSSEWLSTIFEQVEKLASREEYYVKMAVAWLVAECFIKFPDETMEYLKISKLPTWTYNKAISKICDSFRVEKGMKDTLRKMRRKNVQ